MKIGDIDLSRDIMVVAEIGSNHNGDFALAKNLLCQAIGAGADAIKFQTYRAEELIRKDVPAMPHVASRHKYQFERFKSLEFTEAQYHELYDLCNKLGCMFLSTPFDEDSADMLDGLVCAFKVASGDITHYRLLEHLAKKQKPVILSTGMADVSEINIALNILGKNNTVLLHCVSKYPTPDEDANLLSIQYLKDQFQVPVGYSDHTVGILACVTAAAMGSVVIEKHFTYDKTLGFGDHRLSADQFDLMRMVTDIRRVSVLRGSYGKPTDVDLTSRSVMRRGIVAAVKIEKGESLSLDKIKFLRPADGIPCERVSEFLGKTLRVTVEPGTGLKEEYFLG